MGKTSEPFSSHLNDGLTADAADKIAQTRPAPPPQPTAVGNTPDAQIGPNGAQPQVIAAPAVVDKPDWLSIARNAYTSSTTYLDSSLRAQWERNERAWQSQHPSGSKYHSDAYKSRSKLFRPKTRASARQAEAAVASSFFGNEDVVSVEPIDDENPTDQAAAALNKELLQYRLTTSNSKRGVPWFRIVVGAYQDSDKYGIVTSKQWWEFEEVIEEFNAFDKTTNQPLLDANGQPAVMQKPKIVIDRPRVELYPPEQVRIDRGASWLDPVGTSPYVILMNPMYIGDLEQMMTQKPGDGQPIWLQVSRGDLQRAKGRSAWDSTRLARQPNREDPKEADIAIEEYQTTWAHENFMRWKGETLVFWTAGCETLLSEPQPVHLVYPHLDYNELPIVMGQCLIEAHKAYPSGKPQLTQELQQEANEIVNLRLDNVKLALNKRYLVKRGRQVDLRSLTRSSPGAVTLVTDTEGDVKEMEFRDVTASSFAEQDRVNVDFDDIAGNFSPGTVQTNRRLNETVGGMQLMAGSANMIGELDMRVFAETWAEPVLRQLLRMEQTYETDITVIAIAGNKARLYPKFGVDRITDEMLMRDMTVKINVGVGATDPMRKLQKLQVGSEILEKMFGPALLPMMKSGEIVKEIMSALGYRDGRRFFNDQPDPVVTMLQQKVQELQDTIDRQQYAAEGKLKVAEIAGMSQIISTLLKTGASSATAQATLQQKTDQANQGNAANLQQTQITQQHQTKLAAMNNAATSEQRLQQAIDSMRAALLKTALAQDTVDNAKSAGKPGPAGGPGGGAGVPGPANQPPPQPGGASGMAPANGLLPG